MKKSLSLGLVFLAGAMGGNAHAQAELEAQPRTPSQAGDMGIDHTSLPLMHDGYAWTYFCDGKDATIGRVYGALAEIEMKKYKTGKATLAGMKELAEIFSTDRYKDSNTYLTRELNKKLLDADTDDQKAEVYADSIAKAVVRWRTQVVVDGVEQSVCEITQEETLKLAISEGYKKVYGFAPGN
jgi:hypothetical protein